MAVYNNLHIVKIFSKCDVHMYFM